MCKLSVVNMEEMNRDTAQCATSVKVAVERLLFNPANEPSEDDLKMAYALCPEPNKVLFSDGSSFIRYATRYAPNHIEWFLDRGANVNERDNLGKTPLHDACIYSSEGVYVLLQRGADVNALDKQESTALHYSCTYSPQWIGILLDCGANANVLDSYGRTPLYYLCMNWASKLAKFLDPRMDINFQDEDGRTVLHHAVVYQETGVHPLLCNGADSNIQDNDGKTALHLAVLKHGNECVDDLIEFGADVNIQTHARESALDYACWFLPDYVGVFLDIGANPNLRNERDMLPLHHACAHSDIIYKVLRRLYELTDGPIEPPITYSSKLNQLIALYGALVFKRKLPGLPTWIITPYLL